MGARIDKQRRAAFFAALRATGNQTLAAERAKVSRSWVSLHRTADPAFKAAMDAAIADAKARIGAATEMRPAGAWAAQNGEELAVRGSNGRRVQIARARLKQWTPRVETRFLGELATNCNVERACAAVGFSPASAYGHAKRWPSFARRWREALTIGYDRIEGALIESALSEPDPGDYLTDEPLPPVTADHVLQLLRLHQSQARGTGRRAGVASRPKPLPAAEVDAKVWAILGHMERRSARKRARDAERGRVASDRSDGCCDTAGNTRTRRAGSRVGVGRAGGVVAVGADRPPRARRHGKKQRECCLRCC